MRLVNERTRLYRHSRVSLSHAAGAWRQIYRLSNVVSVVIAAILRLVSQLMILLHLSFHIEIAPPDLILSIVEH